MEAKIEQVEIQISRCRRAAAAPFSNLNDFVTFISSSVQLTVLRYHVRCRSNRPFHTAFGI
jgi:hypothetical protein